MNVFIFQIALKCADISNPCRPWSVCKSWSERVCTEFFRQGDLERALQLNISPLCNRFSDSIPAIQTGKLNNINILFSARHHFQTSCLDTVMALRDE